ncbi:MAG: phosphate ABC transporter permease subunit PstC [Planctomycetaceae bacterium]
MSAPDGPNSQPEAAPRTQRGVQDWRVAGRPALWVRLQERLVVLGMFLCASLSVVTTIGILFVLFDNTIYSFTGGSAFFQREEVSVVEFLTGTVWHYEDSKYGVSALICGTMLVAGIAALVGLPTGLASAVYLSEYASPKLRRILKPILEILAGVPTVVYGYFALLFVTPYFVKPVFESLGFRVEVFNALSAGIMVGVMIVPMVCSLSEDALRAVPRSLREAGYALGATKFDVSVRVVVPAALSGIIASFLLAISRAVGETMIVALAAGNMPQVTGNALGPVQTMTAYIVNVTESEVAVGTAEYESLYAVALMLFLLTLVMNIISQAVMRRYREVYQ